MRPIKFTSPVGVNDLVGPPPVIVDPESFAAAFPRPPGGSTIILKSGEMVNVAEGTDMVWELIDDALTPTYEQVEVPGSDDVEGK